MRRLEFDFVVYMFNILCMTCSVLLNSVVMMNRKEMEDIHFDVFLIRYYHTNKQLSLLIK